MIRGFAALMAALFLFHQAAVGDEVKLKHGGLTLNAKLELADGKTVADGIVLIIHGTLAHNGMELIVAQQELLKEREISSLAINLSLGLDDRHGTYDCAVPHKHRHGDAVDEIAAWVGWLKGEGATSIAVMGHSRGGPQVAAYTAGSPDPVVRGAILLAPGSLDPAIQAAGYEKRYGVSLKLLLEEIGDIVAGGGGDEMMTDTDFLYCADAKVTAASFLSYYLAGANGDLVSLIKRAKVPTLAVLGREDDVVPEAKTRLPPLAGDRFRVVVIEDAGHFFRDLYGEDVADAVQEFLEQ